MVIETVKGEKIIADLAREFLTHPLQKRNWKQRILEGASWALVVISFCDMSFSSLVMCYMALRPVSKRTLYAAPGRGAEVLGVGPFEDHE